MSERFPIFVTAEQARTIERALLKLDAAYTEKIMENPSVSTLVQLREQVRRTARCLHE